MLEQRAALLPLPRQDKESLQVMRRGLLRASDAEMFPQSRTSAGKASTGRLSPRSVPNFVLDKQFFLWNSLVSAGLLFTGNRINPGSGSGTREQTWIFPRSRRTVWIAGEDM